MGSNRFNKILELHKSASKVGRRSASGINFSYAESALAEENPGVSFSKEQVLERILEDPVFSNEDLDSIFEINIENHHAKMMNKKERAFIEIGAFLTQKQDHIQEIGDYLISESAKPGWIEERHGDSFFSKESIAEAFSQLDQAQRDFHQEAARRDAEERTAAGQFGNGYQTNEVIKEFEDGWKVVYVPAVGEGPNYKGDPSKSNDRTVEGNILGLCLGSTAGLYQTNNEGKIYSVRDPGNNPRVTIRIHDNILQEAKGKNNLPPDVEAAKKATKWFESQDELQYEDSYDFRKFPPLDAKDAKNKFERNPDEAYREGWIVNWYRSGIDSIDKSVEERIASKDISIIYAGFGKKYKQLVQPVAEYWAKQWTENRHADIWGQFEYPGGAFDKLAHESWKTYRKEPWMIKAAESLMNSRYAYWAFEVIRIHTIPEYTDLARKKVEDIVSEIDEEHRYGVPGVGQRVSEFSFLEKYKFHETYPDLSFPLVKRMARSHPKRFFANKLQNTYPDLGLSLAKEFAEKKPTVLFDDDFNIFESYPDLAEATVKRLAEENPSLFFIIMTSMDHEPPLLDKYPDIALPAAKRLAEENPSLFFDRYLNSYYRDLGIIAAKNVLEKNPDKFFDDGIYKRYPNITLSIAKDLVASANPNESSEEQAVKGPITFFEKGLHNMFPELSYTAAESIARFAPNIFFKKRFPKLFPPPLESAHPLAERYIGLKPIAGLAMGEAVPDELPDEEIGRGKEVPFGNMDEVNPYFSMYEKEDDEFENFYNYPDFNQEEPSDLDFVDPKDSPPPTYVLPEDAVSEVEVTKRRSKLSSLQSYLNKSGLEKEADEVGMIIKYLYQINL